MRKTTSTNTENEKRLAETCGLTYAMILTKGRWTINIMWNIHQGVNRYGLIRNSIDGISQKMLTQRLKELEEMGLIIRRKSGIGPTQGASLARVEYSLSTAGKAFVPVMLALCEWGDHVRPETQILSC